VRQRAGKNKTEKVKTMGICDVGRVCVKIAGRDARKKCVVVEVIDDKYVLIDGETRRRKCNTEHLEPLDRVIELESGANNATVVDALKAEGIVCALKKESVKQPQPRPKKQKVVKKKAPAKEKKTTEETATVKKEKEEKPKNPPKVRQRRTIRRVRLLAKLAAGKQDLRKPKEAVPNKEENQEEKEGRLPEPKKEDGKPSLQSSRVRRNALEVKKAVDEELKELEKKEKQWDVPAFLRNRAQLDRK
jgi:large subunit ribosomal protein L14e